MSKVTSMTPGGALDLDARDPNNLNEHLQVIPHAMDWYIVCSKCMKYYVGMSLNNRQHDNTAKPLDDEDDDNFMVKVQDYVICVCNDDDDDDYYIW